MRTEQVSLNSDVPAYNTLMKMASSARALHNYALNSYTTKNEQGWILYDWVQTNKLMIAREEPTYRALPAKVSNRVLNSLNEDFKGYRSALRSRKGKKGKKTINPPGIVKGKRRISFLIPKECISKKVEKGTAKNKSKAKRGTEIFTYKVFPNLEEHRFTFTTHVPYDEIRCLVIVPCGNHVKIMVNYKVKDNPPLQPRNGRFASMDMGLANFGMVYTNTGIRPRVLSGDGLKRINAKYSYRRALLQSVLPNRPHEQLEAFYENNPTPSIPDYAKTPKQKHEAKLRWQASKKRIPPTTKALQRITTKRKRAIVHEFQRLANLLISFLTDNDIPVLIVGYNRGIKQGKRLGRKTNRAWQPLPIARFIDTLTYKCAEVGIELIVHEESYTSKCSALDLEPVGKHETYVGNRVKRGLFRCANGTTLNADVNGAINIMRKTVSDKVVFAGFPCDSTDHPVFWEAALLPVPLQVTAPSSGDESPEEGSTDTVVTKGCGSPAASRTNVPACTPMGAGQGATLHS